MVSCQKETTNRKQRENKYFIFFLIKIVIVGKLLPCTDMLFRSDYDMLLVVNCNYLRRAVGITRMVEISCLSSKECCIYDILIIYSEHVAISNSFFQIAFFSLVCHFVLDYFSYIFNTKYSLSSYFLSSQPLERNSWNVSFSGRYLFNKNLFAENYK